MALFSAEQTLPAGQKIFSVLPWLHEVVASMLVLQPGWTGS